VSELPVGVSWIRGDRFPVHAEADKSMKPVQPGCRPTFPVAVALAFLVAVGCDGADPTPKPRDVLLITIDTARADRFSYVGAGGPGTPHVDSLAAEGAGFVNAISPVPLTLPAHASLMTGRQPPSHAVRDNGAYRLPEAETTLAELLSGAGYVTGAFVGAQVLDARYGLDRGFTVYDDEIPDPGDAPFLYYAERSGEEVAAAASRWIEAQGEAPLFAWVHLFDPHTPYRPPEPERSRYASAYDGEIAYADRIVGRLLERVAAGRGLERTLIVVTSDHGEALGQHGESTHGVLLHDATLLVPLVIRAPGVHAERPIADPVSLIDVLPTILGLLHLPVPDSVQGRDLGPLLRGDRLPWSRASGYAESLYAQLHHGTAPLRALREGGWKIVRGSVDELYDLAADPGELRDLAGVESVRTAKMAAALEDLVGSLDVGDAAGVALDEESRRALESLGYAWSRPVKSAGGAAPRDPRQALASMRRMADADRDFLAGDVAGAIVGYRAVIEAEPDSVDARVRLAQLLISEGRGADAVDLLAQAVAIAPHEPILHRKLGRLLERLGRYAEALAAYDAGLARHPRARELRDGRWRCLNALRRWDEMLAEAERAVDADPGDGMARFARAVACCSQPLDRYVAALQRELEELPGDPILEAALAQARAGG
jgi:arylsulfatase A-like enzyme